MNIFTYILIFLVIAGGFIPIIAKADKLKVGDYAIVRFIRRKGSTTEWKPGAKVKIIDEHIGEDIGIGVETDYTVIMENEDIAFPTKEQLEKINE